MMAIRSQFIDGDLSDNLTDNNDTKDNNEAHIIKHISYYSESQFSKLLNKNAGVSIHSVNIQHVNAKFDEFQAFIDKINVIKLINVICLQEC